MVAIFGENWENFLKIGMAIPVDQKFCRNRSISYGFRDISIFVFAYLENS